VLCERPIAATAADARVILEAARAREMHLVEAYPHISQPQTSRASFAPCMAGILDEFGEAVRSETSVRYFV
jgi:hypothetical protein